ncbi:NAD(P)/FAD-dependent oxidoreductase [Grimontia sp. NTOU-MAR1]|uniref:NAD(P)/FAD-dependent oxidoreductase n=1 Tax=Grimontia sp. NTOU-MAR1 TaxID=3111011 RepID=UPI002DB5DA82|nr:FAD/NAD(P)-binding oxidoreductase [Grimontia sp. NTOU-MAR1]WRV98784.1 FAD/NAD(P)-binding oxidoreductase [Grimontia sp. NTOU-MAR1]
METQTNKAMATYDVVIVGAGAGGIAVASSLLKRDRELNVTIIDPSENHFYQPGWTLVGGGVFDFSQTERETAAVIPKSAKWIKQAVRAFTPDKNTVTLDDGKLVEYKYLVVSPGLTLDWDAIEGLKSTLGNNGVTSNYHVDLSPYTWESVKQLKKGKAVFTQPPMPIKCAGAPQKALYLSAHYWERNRLLDNINIQFHTALPSLFGVPDFVPALQSYMKRYGASPHFNSQLVSVDGQSKTAIFSSNNENQETQMREVKFDLLHVVPPQRAPQFIAESALADSNGWLDVSHTSLRHRHYDNIWGIGDVIGAPNAKTAAAVRKQAPIVAENIIRRIGNQPQLEIYDGYGACPLTVEKGKVVLAEFGYGGKLKPTFPSWILDGSMATKTAWNMKAHLFPYVYWNMMLKGHELLTKME